MSTSKLANEVAEVIQLSAVVKPQIHACTQRFGTILEKVVYDPISRRIDLDAEIITENTRLISTNNLCGSAYATLAPCSTRPSIGLSWGDFTTDPIFGFKVPLHCNGVPDDVLDPASSWSNGDEYMECCRQRAKRFIVNF